MKQPKVFFENKFANSYNIGRVMRAWRESKGISQREVADKLGLRNANYISMIESGRSTMPMARIPHFIKAYGMNQEFAMVVLRGLFPEVFDIVFSIMESTEERTIKGAKKRSDQILQETADEFKIKIIDEEEMVKIKVASSF